MLANKGKFVFKNEPLDLGECIAQVLREFDVTGSRRKLSLTFEPPSVIPAVHADNNRVRQILINLLDNAIKYTQEGGVTVCTLKVEVVIPARAFRWSSSTSCSISFNRHQVTFLRVITPKVRDGVCISLAS
jgi:signal transduction histidine kinase